MLQPRGVPATRLIVVVAVLSWACESPYRSQIGEVPGPDTALDPDPSARERWTTTRVGDVALRAVTCEASGAGAYAVGRGGAAVWIGPDGRASAAPAAPADLGAIAATPDGFLGAGRGALFATTAGGAPPETWQRSALPRADAWPHALALAAGDTLWVAGRAPKGSVTVGWVARRKAGQWLERLVEDVPAVTQILPRDNEAILVVEATPYVWAPATGGGAVTYYMPAQPDAHPPIAALARTSFGFHAVGPDNTWRLEGKRLVRELRQLYQRLESVASLPGGRAIAVGRDDPPGGRAGGIALARDPKGHWRRELFLDGQPLHAVVHCGTRTIAVGEGGLVAVRGDEVE